MLLVWIQAVLVLPIISDRPNHDGRERHDDAAVGGGGARQHRHQCLDAARADELEAPGEVAHQQVGGDG